MKNLFFVVLSFAFFLTSCTKDFVEPTITETGKVQKVSNRTEIVEISVVISSVNVGIEDTILEMVDWDNDPTGLTIQPTQILEFFDGETPVYITVEVISIGIEDTILEMVIPSENFDNLEIGVTQTLNFN